MTDRSRRSPLATPGEVAEVFHTTEPALAQDRYLGKGLQSFFMLGHNLCMATATHHLIEHQLKGTSLRGLVFTRRRAGVSWQAIANEVRDLTGVIVSRVTLRNWYPDAPAPQTAASA